MTSRYSCGGLHTSTDKLYSQTLLTNYSQTLLTNFTDKLYSQTLLTNFTHKLYSQTLLDKLYSQTTHKLY